ncbi:MAG: hypothetical protein R3B48_10710 [Kofleriaceae bacterium]
MQPLGQLGSMRWVFVLLLAASAACGSSKPKGRAASRDAERPAASAASADAEPEADTPGEEETGGAEVDEDPVAVAGGEGEDPDDENNPRVKAANELLEREDIGGVRLGMTDKAVIAKLGKPSKKGRAVTEEASGDRVAAWQWKQQGVSVMFAEVKKKLVVRSVQLQEGSRLKTKAGIGLGSSRDEVDAAYGRGHRPSEEDPELTYIVGTMYHGLAIGLEDDKVTSLYWGQLAE